MHDLAIINGLVVDGSGESPYAANICVKDGRISCITAEPVADAGCVLDAAGRIVSPGFIDIHSHSDGAPLIDYLAESKIAQGVTTEIVGNCGQSCIPATPETVEALSRRMNQDLQLPLYGAKIGRLSVSDYARDAEAAGIVNNFGNLIGHNALRIAVMGPVDRTPNEEEMEQLKALLSRELERGAFGMSLGLNYPPSAFSKKEELIELAKVLKKYDAILSVHMRNEGAKVFEATDEMISVAEESGVHVQISHLKLLGKPQWGRSDELLWKIEAARARGVNVTCDQYPFTASSTSLTAVIPHWVQEGGYDAMLERLRQPTKEMRTEIAEKVEERGGAHTILVTSTNSALPDCESKFINEIADVLGLDPVDAIIKLLLDANAVVKCVFFCMDEDDMLHIMPKDYVCVGSDGYAYSYDPKYTPNNPHPRSFGTFPQFFQTVREKNLMPVEKAVHKVSGLPAKWLGMNDRGVLKVGYAADITVFDPQRIENLSTYMNSKVRPKGIDYVIVNGKLAMEHGALTAERAGRVLLHR